MDKRNLESIFTETANKNTWGNKDSLSGPGSNLRQTEVIRHQIPKFVLDYKIKSILDVPCGDFFWMGKIIDQLLCNTDRYIGADIVPSIIKENKEKYGGSEIDFVHIDITLDNIPTVDLILTRDCFIHLSYRSIYLALKNYKESGSKYLLLSTYSNKKRKNSNINEKGLHFRALNMENHPFYFKNPIEIVNEKCSENGEYADKSLALWNIAELKVGHILLFAILSEYKMMLGNTPVGKFWRYLKKVNHD